MQGHKAAGIMRSLQDTHMLDLELTEQHEVFLPFSVLDLRLVHDKSGDGPRWGTVQTSPLVAA